MITMSKKFKKSMAMAMATAMAFSVQALPVYQAEKVNAKTEEKKAECTAKIEYDFSEEGEMICVSPPRDGSSIVYYGITTKKDGKTKTISPAAYEALDLSRGLPVIDLSWVSRKKDQVLCITTGTSIEEIKPIEIDLKAQDTLIATYSSTLEESKKKDFNVIGNDDEGYLTFAKGDKKNSVAVSASAVQFRTANSWGWGSAESLELAGFSTKGATLQMRVAPNDETKTPAGKIINVKIKAKSKAPKVTVDYNNKLVNGVKKTEFSYDGSKWTAAGDDKSKAFDKFEWDGITDKTVYFRTSGDSKKAASKIAYVTIKKEATDFAEITTPVSGASVIPDVPKVGAGKLDARYKTAYDIKSGLVFTNTTDHMYQVAYAKKADINKDAVTKEGSALVAASSAAIVSKDAKKVKWTTINAQNTAKGKPGTATIKLGKNDKEDDYVILYRICDKKGTTVNSQTKISSIPAIVKQSVELTKDNKVVSSSGINMTVSGVAVTDLKAGNVKETLVISGSGLVATSPKFTVTAYSDEACKTKETKAISVKLTTDKKSVEIKATDKSEVGKTYYVVLTVEGTRTVLTVKFI